jgi:hypothetical protein
VFPQRVGGGPDLDRHAPFPRQVGPQGEFFACASYLGWLGLSFEPLTAIIGVKLVWGDHIACFLCGLEAGPVWTLKSHFHNKLDHKDHFFHSPRVWVGWGFRLNPQPLLSGLNWSRELTSRFSSQVRWGLAWCWRSKIRGCRPRTSSKPDLGAHIEA